MSRIILLIAVVLISACSAASTVTAPPSSHTVSPLLGCTLTSSATHTNARETITLTLTAHMAVCPTQGVTWTASDGTVWTVTHD